MKRDMELIKKILLHIESSPNFYEPIETSIDGYEISNYMYHVKLLYEARFIEIFGDKPISVMGAIPSYFPTCLTWEGHEFLEASRSPKIWNNALKVIKDKGLGMSFDVLKALLSAYALHEVGLK
jgi:hypothetical protein